MNQPTNFNGQNNPAGGYGQGMPPYPQYNGMPNQSMQQPLPPNGQMPPMPGMTPGANGAAPNGKKKNGKKKSGKKSNVGNVFLGILLMFVLIGLGIKFGYDAAISTRKSEESRQRKVAAAEQYELAKVDLDAKKYDNAKKRLEYVMSVDPEYPGADETYQQVLVEMASIVVPTIAPTDTPAPTATPDLRGEEDMFQGIQMAMAAQNWQSALEQMDALRDKNIEFRAVEVDGMYYIALRNLGIQLINSGYLESGVYKITEAESFGPVDYNADSMRVAARSYLAGAGFWEIDWDKALEYYTNALNSVGTLYDRATGMTAQERYVKASFAVGDRYVETEDYCGAIPYYEQGLAYSGDELLQGTATAVYEICNPPQIQGLTDDEESYSYEEYDPAEEEYYEEPQPDSGDTEGNEEILGGDEEEYYVSDGSSDESGGVYE